MGFDLSGVKPRSTKGKDFRNNCWWWRPLWSYVTTHCGDFLTLKDQEMGEWNEGRLIPEEKAKRIAIRLEHLIKQGSVKAHEIEYKEIQENLSDEECYLCHGTGQRNDMVVLNGCNVCHGSGKVRPKICDYPFLESNVKEFAEFCRYSGGFKIW
jgi:hypothetical protein